jgi:hypothetical protein
MNTDHDGLIAALLGHPQSAQAEIPTSPTSPVPPEGGYRTSIPLEKHPTQEHNDALADLLARRRFESQQ